jgi:hypothetical protein
MPEPNGEAVVGVCERDVDVELVRDPQPKSKPVVRGAAWRGDQAGQTIGWAVAAVVNGDHDAVRRGPDACGRRRAAVAFCVGDCLGDADQQVLDCGGGDAAAADLRECTWYSIRTARRCDSPRISICSIQACRHPPIDVFRVDLPVLDCGCRQLP